MKKTLSLFLCLLLVCISSSCTNRSNNVTDDNSTSNSSEILYFDYTVSTEESSSDVAIMESTPIINSFPESLYQDGEVVSFRIDNIDAPDNYIIYDTTASRRENIDYQGLIEELWPDNLPYTSESDNYRYNEEYGLSAMYESNKVFLFDTMSFYYDRCYTSDPKYNNSNLYLYSEAKEFEFGTAEECLNQIIAQFEDYGYDLTSNTRIETYYLDYETLSENEYAIDIDGNEDTSLYKPDGWSAEDNAYMFYFFVDYDGIQAYGDRWSYSVRNVEAYELQIIYNKNGYVSVRQNIPQRDFNVVGSSIELMDFNSVINAVEIVLNSMSTNNSTYTVTDAILYASYQAFDGAYHVTPTWVFVVHDSNECEFEVHINAINGQVIQPG